MKSLKIELKKNNSSQKILNFLETTEAREIIFLCPRNFLLLTDVSFLKKIRQISKEKKNRCIFIVSQKFIRDIIISEKLETHKQIPAEFINIKKDNLPDEKTIIAKKNILEKPEKTIKAVPPPKFNTRKIENKTSEKYFSGYIFFGILFLIFILLGIFFWISPSAKIFIKPKISLIPFTQNVIIKMHEAKIPEENKNLPTANGIFVETEITDTQIFPTTGRTYDITNAYGEVTIFNETSKPKIFIPSRLSTTDGMIFRFKEKITVPPKKGNKAGRFVVKIFADKFDEKERPIGERGNIIAGTELFFPALRKESRELYYAKTNRGPLVGGSTLTHYFLQKSDLEVAEKLLVESFRIKGTEKLQQEIKKRSQREKKNYVLLTHPKLLKHEVINIIFPPEENINKEQQTFEISAKIILKGIVFDEKQVIEFLETKMTSSQDFRKKLIRLDESSVNYEILNLENFLVDHWVKLSVSIFGIESINLDYEESTKNIWYVELKKKIAGKNISEARSILLNHPEIESIKKMKLSPFWQKNLPKIYDKIKMEIIFDE